jgi:hypothetical protein
VGSWCKEPTNRFCMFFLMCWDLGQAVSECRMIMTVATNEGRTCHLKQPARKELVLNFVYLDFLTDRTIAKLRSTSFVSASACAVCYVGPCLEANLVPKIWSYTPRCWRHQDSLAENISCNLTLTQCLILKLCNSVMTQVTSLAFPVPGRQLCCRLYPTGYYASHIARVLCFFANSFRALKNFSCIYSYQ